MTAAGLCADGWNLTECVMGPVNRVVVEYNDPWPDCGVLPLLEEANRLGLGKYTITEVRQDRLGMAKFEWEIMRLPPEQRHLVQPPPERWIVSFVAEQSA